MDNRRFSFWNKICATAVLLVSLATYLLTLEPTASFWDCGEFIASSYKLEVGHPPGNPVFQVIARVFTMFAGDPSHVAVTVNAMSALCSALTIFFLYLTIVFLAKRLLPAREDGSYGTGSAVAIFGSGLVGALAYCFSDTFWFSAVEGEVYAMSSLFTAMVFWAMTRWYEEADRPCANRWIVLISFLMGLSIGVHLLNLLTIPCLVFMFYYRRRENGKYDFRSLLTIFLLSCIILAVILFGIIPWLPKIAAYVDLFFVNVLGLPYNSGAAVFLALLLAGCFLGLFSSLRKGQVLLNTALLCFTTIVIGFSVFSICIVRSSVKTPTNEYQPDNPFTLVRYLGREQYGSSPLLYGQYFDAPYDVETERYWAPLTVGGKKKYVLSEGPGRVKYDAAGKMLFPRMWSSSDPKYIRFYESYMDGKGTKVNGAEHRKPTMWANLSFFLDYQLGWMYGRYFMWNFVGRQNDIHGSTPGDIFQGNWESGIGAIDRFRLGDQRDAPDYLKNNKGKNHYYFLPLLLGLIGLFFQFGRDRRGSWITFLLFFMTGVAIVLYLNQPPFQVRERDYAYAGSFYAFSIWIGLAVAGLYAGLCSLSERIGGDRSGGVLAGFAGLCCLAVPVLMACQNWDDHDRSHRYTAPEVGRNYLESAGKNGILVTHGDNDTFPLWYVQEVEGVRTDVRIVNTSLLGTDWYIDQMKYACNQSAPLPLQVDARQYLYGTNEYVYIVDKRETVIPISQVMRVFRHPDAKVELYSGRMVDYIMSRRISVPVNKENVLRSGILPASMADRIPDEIVLTMPKEKKYLSKPELFFLDFLSNYQWDRPVNFLSMGGDINIGIKEYFLYDGFSYRLVPIRNKMRMAEIGLADPEDLYEKMMHKFSWKALSRKDWFVDYQNTYTFAGVISQRLLFVNAVKQMIRAGREDRALELLDKCMVSVPEEVIPMDLTLYGFSNELMVAEIIDLYFQLGREETALDLSARFVEQLRHSAVFFSSFYDYAKTHYESAVQYTFHVADILRKYGHRDLADQWEKDLEDALELD